LTPLSESAIVYLQTESAKAPVIPWSQGQTFLGAVAKCGRMGNRNFCNITTRKSDLTLLSDSFTIRPLIRSFCTAASVSAPQH